MGNKTTNKVIILRSIVYDENNEPIYTIRHKKVIRITHKRKLNMTWFSNNKYTIYH